MVDEPKIYGQPNHPDPVPPAPPEVLQHPSVQEALNGQPPKLVLGEDGVLRTAEKHVVTFRHSNPKHELLEVLRQARLQEDGLNRMSAKDLIDNLADYAKREPEAPGARRRYNGTARPTEAPWFGQGHPLHSPDMVAGGDVDAFDGYGHAGVNHSLGTQWKSRAEAAERWLDAEVESLGPMIQRWVQPSIEVRVERAVA